MNPLECLERKPFKIGQSVKTKGYTRYTYRNVEGKIIDAYFNSHPTRQKREKKWILLISFKVPKAEYLMYMEKYLYEVELINEYLKEE